MEEGKGENKGQKKENLEKGKCAEASESFSILGN